MADLFWLPDERWAVPEPAHGSLQSLQQVVPARLPAGHAGCPGRGRVAEAAALDSTYVKAQRSAHGGAKARPSDRRGGQTTKVSTRSASGHKRP
jgi:hypothetical protein